jgi:hypothetical protein
LGAGLARPVSNENPVHSTFDKQFDAHSFVDVERYGDPVTGMGAGVVGMSLPVYDMYCLPVSRPSMRYKVFEVDGMKPVNIVER